MFKARSITDETPLNTAKLYLFATLALYMIMLLFACPDPKSYMRSDAPINSGINVHVEENPDAMLNVTDPKLRYWQDALFERTPAPGAKAI
jgi:hypothetical protein